MSRQINERLAALISQRQVTALTELQRIDNAIDKHMRWPIERLAELIAGDEPLPRKLLGFSEIMQRLIDDMRQTVNTKMHHFAAWSHRSAAEALVKAIPRSWLLTKVPLQARFELESTKPVKRGWLLMRAGELRLVYEEDTSPKPFGVPIEPLAKPVLLDLDKDEVLQSILFPPPSAKEVAQIIARTGWEERFTNLSRLITDKRALFGQLVTGYSEGENLKQLKTRVLPLVAGVQASAKRIARTEAMRVAERLQRRAWEPLGEMLAGAQILAILDERTRPEHAARNGQVFYKYPKGNQKGMDQLPDLPDGPNCRCMSVPVLEPPEEINTDPVFKAQFQNAQGVGFPDPAAYDEWFAQADERQRMVVVGVKRYREMEAILAGQRQPEWTDFVTAAGKLMPINDLRNEDVVARIARKQSVQSVIDARTRLLKQMAEKGFIWSGPATKKASRKSGVASAVTPDQKRRIRADRKRARMAQYPKPLYARVAPTQLGSFQERVDRLLSAWTVNSTNQTTALELKEAAIREFRLRGSAYSTVQAQFRAEDMTLTQADLRRIYNNTQEDFQRKGITSVTMYRGRARGIIEEEAAVSSWTANEKIARLYAGPDGQIETRTFPVTEILLGQNSPNWKDGPRGNQEEYLVIY